MLVPSDYHQATLVRDRLEQEYKRAARELEAMSGGGPMGLTPDAVRATAAWRDAKRDSDAAFASLRAFNEVYVRRFKREIAGERRHRRNPAHERGGHFRIQGEGTRLVGGEFATYSAAATWARQHMRGFWTVVECDRYGNPLRPLQHRNPGRPGFDLRRYGDRMLQWHSGQGDPIYAVGSFALDGKVHPSRETIGRAQSILESLSRDRKLSARDQRDVKLLAEQTGELIGDTEDRTLDPFTRGYLEAALFSSNDESDESGGEPLDKNYSIADFAPEAIKKAIADCARFQEQNAADLEDFDEEEAGADFWFTRCGHGVGYWDGDYPKPQATRLTESAKKFGEVWVSVGDDGLIYTTS